MKARQMFDGEKASLEAIQATKTIRVPKPGPILDNPSGTGTIFIMEHLDLQGLSKHSAALGEHLARYDPEAMFYVLEKYASCYNKLKLLRINAYDRACAAVSFNNYLHFPAFIETLTNDLS